MQIETICMKCQILFCGKIRKNISIHVCRLLKIYAECRVDYHIFPKYPDTLPHYHICPKNLTSSFYYLQTAELVANTEGLIRRLRRLICHHCLLSLVCPNSHSKYGISFIQDKRAFPI